MSSGTVDLVVVEQFLNTLDERSFSRHGEDHAATDALSSPEALAGWLRARDLLGPDDEMWPADFDAALALRAALRDALTGGAPTGTGLPGQGDVGRTAEALVAFPLRLVPEAGGGLRLTAAGAPPGLDVLVATVGTGVATGRWHRLKLCASPDCRWAFYDTSRNGGGRWCSMEVCGNRHKTRSYRQRQAAG